MSMIQLTIMSILLSASISGTTPESGTTSAQHLNTSGITHEFIILLGSNIPALRPNKIGNIIMVSNA